MPRRSPAFLLSAVLLTATVNGPRVNAAASVSREQTIIQIQELIQKHDLIGARRSLAKSMTDFPGDAGLENLLGVIEAEENHYAAAEKAFEVAIEHDPKITSAYLNLGRLYQENQGHDSRALTKARKVYEQLLSYDPANREANYQSATLYLQNGNYQESLSRLSQLPGETRAGAQALSIECADYAGLADRQQADQIASRVAKAPDLSEDDVSLIVPVLHRVNRDDITVMLLEKLQERQPLSSAMQHHLGLAYEASGKLTEARSTMEHWATNGNLSVPALLELGRIAHEQKDYRGSLGYLAHARDLDPSNAGTHYSFGMVCLDLELIAEARKSFEKAVTLQPDNASYNYAMGSVSALSRDPSDAIPYFEKYLKLKPNEVRGKLALGAALFRAKDYDAAIPWLTEAAQNSDTAAAAHYYLGSLDLQESRLDDAANELQLAISKNPHYADALAELGHYYLLRKNYSESEAQLRRALAIEPDHFSANFYLLTLFTRTSDPRREAQAKRYDELQKLREQKSVEVLRMVEVRPFDNP
jgi:tetratricopeptide (TPR) repeat protein